VQSLALDLPKTVGSTRLRVLLPTDLARFAAYRSDPALAEYQSWEPMDHAAAESFLTDTASATHFNLGGWIQLAVADERTDELLGDVGLFLSGDGTYAEIGFTLARNSQGRGHATRAAQLAIEQFFRIETVREVRAITDQLNHASVAVLSRVGFVRTAARDAVFKGKPCVELLFARGRGDA
jgi:[ribosomal protein S5]-alanine N-acetyltransferase